MKQFAVFHDGMCDLWKHCHFFLLLLYLLLVLLIQELVEFLLPSVWIYTQLSNFEDILDKYYLEKYHVWKSEKFNIQLRNTTEIIHRHNIIIFDNKFSELTTHKLNCPQFQSLRGWSKQQFIIKFNGQNSIAVKLKKDHITYLFQNNSASNNWHPGVWKL